MVLGIVTQCEEAAFHVGKEDIGQDNEEEEEAGEDDSERETHLDEQSTEPFGDILIIALGIVMHCQKAAFSVEKNTEYWQEKHGTEVGGRWRRTGIRGKKTHLDEYSSEPFGEILIIAFGIVTQCEEAAFSKGKKTSGNQRNNHLGTF